MTEAAVKKTLTPEQEERRRVVSARTAFLCEHGVKRGPNAPANRIFGGKADTSKGK